MKLGLTDAQRAERRLGIGGSDAGAIMKGEWRRLWREKTGRAEPEDLSGNLAVMMGSATEDFNAFWFEKVTGREVISRGDRIAGGPRFHFMRANLDGVTTTRQGHPAYWDAKHIGGKVEDAVVRYTPQMTHCATLLAADWWVLSIFIGNSKHEIVEQQVDPFYAEEMIAREREFWGYVERDEEPPEEAEPVLAPKPQPLLRIVQLEDAFKGGWPNWGSEMTRHFGEFALTKAMSDRHFIAREQIKKLLPDDVGTVTRGAIKLSRTKAGAITIAIHREKASQT